MSTATRTRSLAARQGLGAMSPTTRRMGLHGLGYVGVILGGSVTGYLASGSKRGAFTGALVHVAFYGLTGATLGGGRLTTMERVSYGGLGLVAAASAGYLWMNRR